MTGIKITDPLITQELTHMTTGLSERDLDVSEETDFENMTHLIWKIVPTIKGTCRRNLLLCPHVLWLLLVAFLQVWRSFEKVA